MEYSQNATLVFISAYSVYVFNGKITIPLSTRLYQQRYLFWLRDDLNQRSCQILCGENTAVSSVVLTISLAVILRRLVAILTKIRSINIKHMHIIIFYITVFIKQVVIHIVAKNLSRNRSIQKSCN